MAVFAVAVIACVVSIKITAAGHQSLLTSPTDGSTSSTHAPSYQLTDPRQHESITLTCVVCRDRLQEALTMLKSAILMSHSPLRVLAFVEPELSARFKVGLDALVHASAVPVTFELLPPTFPEPDTKMWREMYLPCTTQRLFMPDLLASEDAVIYTDTDTLFLSPVEQVWEQFGRMNATQLAAMAPENVGQCATYSVRHPYYGQGGVNAGVLLMNLTRMRGVNFTQLVVKVNKEFNETLIYADQGILNIIFHFHPSWLLELPCRFNYKHHECELGCASANELGIAILHGHSNSFHMGRVPGTRAVYDAFSAYRLGLDPLEHLVAPMRRNLQLVRGDYCAKDHNAETFLRSITTHIFEHPRSAKKS